MNSQDERNRGAWVGAVGSELVKLRTLLSNRMLIAAAVLIIAGSGGMLSMGMVSRLTDPRFAGQDIAAVPMMFVDGVLWAQILVAILAVLAVAGEYASGQVRLSLLALPTRLPWLGAKALVLAAAGFAIGAVGSAISLGISALVLPGTDVRYDIDLPGAAALSLDSGLYLAAIAVLSVGLTTALRHVVAALVAVLALLVVAPPLLSSIPGVGRVADYLPTIAGRRLISDFDSIARLDPWAGYGVLLVWAFAALLASGALLRARDA